MPQMEDDRIVKRADEVRGGSTGYGARYVLAIGTIGVIVFFAIVYLYFFA